MGDIPLIQPLDFLNAVPRTPLSSVIIYV
jgi:hypothetical protein